MPKDPLGLPDILAELPKAADYDAIYAAVIATERGRRFLTEYANRNRHADTLPLVGAIAGVEAAIRGDPPPQSSTTLNGDLIKVVSAIERIRAEMLSETQPADGFAAAERIQDIAFALREREVDAKLCDALDAAVRRICETLAVHERASQRFLKAEKLLRDLTARVGNIVALPIADQAAPPAAAENAAVAPIGNDAASAVAVDCDMPPRAGLLEAEVLQDENFAQVVAALAAALPAPADQTQPLEESEEDPGDLFEPPAKPFVTPPAVAASRAIPRAPSDDSLAEMQALSEEEIIALFS